MSRRSATMSGDRPLSMTGLGGTELSVLHLIRLYCQSFAQPETQAWMRCFQVSEARFSGAGGLSVAKAILQVLQAMRVVRREGFRFSNPDCPDCSLRLTEHERQLMAAIVAARQGRSSAVHANTMVLCEGGNAGALITAIRDLAGLLPDTDSRQTATFEKFPVHGRLQ